jgi:lysophospholipase L1-like esterase
MNAGLRAALAVVFAVWTTGAAQADPPGSAGVLNCAVPAALVGIGPALGRSAARIERAGTLTIVAFGSSSTKGFGASSPAMSYPSRFERALRNRFPGVDIRVVNRGVGGEDVRLELARLDRDVLAEQPDLVIWQVGTNAVLRRDDVSGDEQLIEGGVAAMKARGIDVVLMDLQYAPKVLARPALGEMERIIAAVARRAEVGYFRRFEIMRTWAAGDQLAPAAMIGPDGLHMTDASYGCLADRLASAIEANLAAGAKIAKSRGLRPNAVAVLPRPGAPAAAGP